MAKKQTDSEFAKPAEIRAISKKNRHLMKFFSHLSKNQPTKNRLFPYISDGTMLASFVVTLLSPSQTSSACPQARPGYRDSGAPPTPVSTIARPSLSPVAIRSAQKIKA
jgi:hypothetical protein